MAAGPHLEEPCLTVCADPWPVRSYPLNGDEMLLGRGKECDIVLPGKRVSQKHIKIKRVDGLYYVEDLSSQNGTTVNGSTLTDARRLAGGDRIVLANAVRLIFNQVSDTFRSMPPIVI